MWPKVTNILSWNVREVCYILQKINWGVGLPLIIIVNKNVLNHLLNNIKFIIINFS